MTYGTNKTSPTPFSTESFNGLFMVPDTLLTPFAFGKPQPNMTSFTVRMSFIYGKPNVIRFELAISLNAEFSTS